MSAEELFNHMQLLIIKRYQGTTCATYHRVWKIFNKFLIQLDVMPHSWEERTALFCAYLIRKGTQSRTIRSYISAIKALLKDDS